MILLVSVLLGFLLKLAKSWYTHAPLQVSRLGWAGLAVVAFLPQLAVFYLPRVRDLFTNAEASAALLISQLLLLAFILPNRRQAGFWIIGLGLLLNFCVIVLNGGFMPISPEMATYVTSGMGPWEAMQRFGKTKDMVMPIQATLLQPLSDALWLPAWLPFKGPFSVGDVLVCIGTMWFLWKMGERTELRTGSISPAT